MAGGKTPPGQDGVLPNDANAAIEQKEAREEHWRRSGEIEVEESDPPRGAHPAGRGDRKPPSPSE